MHSNLLLIIFNAVVIVFILHACNIPDN